MNTRKAILTYMYAERIKSELIIASNLLATMDTLDGNERLGAERKIMEAIGKVKLHKISEINQCISEALSLITTCSAGAMKVLMSQQLI
jgi:hypothetical protein